MTDKELAEEYAFTHYGDTDNDGNPLTDDVIMQRTFLAGLQVGRPKWHDLRKNPEDLPEQSALFWDISKKVIGAVKIAPNQYCSMVAYYSFPDKKWKTLEDPYTADVIAWCEMPRFEEVSE